MSSKLTIIARIKAKQEKVDIVKRELLKLLEPTRQEQGCLQYDLHQDNEDATLFVFYENWVSRELWQKHMGSEHLKAYKEATDDAVENLLVYEMSHIESD